MCMPLPEMPEAWQKKTVKMILTILLLPLEMKFNYSSTEKPYSLP